MLPSLVFIEEFDFSSIVGILDTKFSVDMEDGELYFKNELIRWKMYWEKEMKGREEKSRELKRKDDRKSN